MGQMHPAESARADIGADDRRERNGWRGVVGSESLAASPWQRVVGREWLVGSGWRGGRQGGREWLAGWLAGCRWQRVVGKESQARNRQQIVDGNDEWGDRPCADGPPSILPPAGPRPGKIVLVLRRARRARAFNDSCTSSAHGSTLRRHRDCLPGPGRRPRRAYRCRCRSGGVG
jgi:hypothetical protein